MGLAYFNCLLSSARWHFKFLFPNCRMDKYCIWLICWSRIIFTLQHLPMSQREVQLSLGNPPYRRSNISMQDSIPNDFQQHLKQSTVWFSRSHLGEMCPFSVTSAFGPHLNLRALCKGGAGLCQAFGFISCDSLVLSWPHPEKAVRGGPCRDSWPNLRLLSGQGNPSRTDRKRSFSITYSHWEQVNSLLFSSKQWIQGT